MGCTPVVCSIPRRGCRTPPARRVTRGDETGSAGRDGAAERGWLPGQAAAGTCPEPPESTSLPEMPEEDTSCSRLSVMTGMVEEYIRSNYMYEISMSDAARAVNYSEPYFCKMFKQQFGQNFTSYLADYRIAEAKKLLDQPNVIVKEVGARVGYPDSNYFTKVFRRLTGMNPSDYRNEMLKEL